MQNPVFPGGFGGVQPSGVLSVIIFFFPTLFLFLPPHPGEQLRDKSSWAATKHNLQTIKNIENNREWGEQPQTLLQVSVLEGWFWRNFWVTKQTWCREVWCGFFFFPAATLFIISKIFMHQNNGLILQAVNTSWQIKRGQSTTGNTYQKYSIACPISSPSKNQINLSLLEMLLGHIQFLLRHRMVHFNLRQEQQTLLQTSEERSLVLWCSARTTPLGSAATDKAEALLWSLQSCKAGPPGLAVGLKQPYLTPLGT